MPGNAIKYYRGINKTSYIKICGDSPINCGYYDFSAARILRIEIYLLGNHRA
jgi:hypothetical protein